jgi:uncharacterized protein (TIGR01777 family)
MATILITGGTGLIGKALTKTLTSQGHRVHILSRTPHAGAQVPEFYWNVEKQEIDEKAFEGVEHIVHLAGIGIADKRWTEKRKKEIIDSRVDSMKLITGIVKKKALRLKSVVGASAIGIYGMEPSERIFSENDRGPEDFLWKTCELWERSYDEIASLSDKTTILRIGVVLSEKGGAMKRLLPIFKSGLGSPIGNGKQYMPWIHLDDMVSVIVESLFNPAFEGIYNAVASEHMTNAYFSESIAKALSKPYFMPAVPAFAMKLLYGEMANVLLRGARASNQKLLGTGFRFKYPELKPALEAIVK